MSIVNSLESFSLEKWNAFKPMTWKKYVKDRSVTAVSNETVIKNPNFEQPYAKGIGLGSSREA